MLKPLVRNVIAASLLAASAFAGAAEPITLTPDQLDTVSAGSMADFLGSIAAYAWASSTAVSTPGIATIINGQVLVQVGLSGNGITFTHSFQLY